MSMRKRYRRYLLLAGLLLLGGAGSASGAPDLIAVVDSSGSMYGRINGVFKLHIAIDAVDRLAANLPESGRVGVVAYGHRGQGCNDVETLLPLGSHSPEQLDDRLNRLRAGGQAPLTAAIREALTQIRSPEQTTTLLLVVDSTDSCGLDPCAMIQGARNRGFDFEAHVLGLRLDDADLAAMRCVTEAGRGRLHNVRSLSDLDFALGQVLFATLSTTAPTLVAMPAPGSEALDLRTPELITTAPAATGAGGSDARLNAPDALTAGQSFQVGWSGPGGQWDYITLVRRGAPEGEYGRYAYIRDGNPLTMQAPADAGGFELRYVDGMSQRTLVRQPVNVTQ